VAKLRAEQVELMQNLNENKDELENEKKLSALGNNIAFSDFRPNPAFKSYNYNFKNLIKSS
jgi:hypothetical protein